MPPTPAHLDLKRDAGLTVQWNDGSTSFYPVDYLRHMSPSADARALREEMARNPLTVLPSGMHEGPLLAESAEFIGNYAVKIRFSDGHDTGIYSWAYLREIDPEAPDATHPAGYEDDVIETPLPDLSPVDAIIDLAPFRIPHPRPHVLSLQTTPALGSRAVDHVSNIEYVRWIDRAAELHADSLGYTRVAMLEANLMWFVARHEIDYRAEVGLDDHLIIATWVRDFRRVKSWRDFVIFRPSDQTVVCEASTLWVLVDLTTRRPTRIPNDMIAAFDPLPAPPTPD